MSHFAGHTSQSSESCLKQAAVTSATAYIFYSNGSILSSHYDGNMPYYMDKAKRARPGDPG